MATFGSMDLDDRILRALVKLGFKAPTLVQEKAIPLALSGKDILARARTENTSKGFVNSYLGEVASIQALVLVPTRELAAQVTGLVGDLTIYCSKSVKAVNIAFNDVPLSSQTSLLNEMPQIIVSTPSRISQHLEANNITLKDLESLVIDEADLILSYGYDEDVEKLLAHLPKLFQSYLMSATLSPDVDKLKKLVLRNPAILTLEEDLDSKLLTQYYIKCTEEDKFLLLYFMLKLRMHPFGSKKTLIFVNTIDRCYKVKLFLEQFGIKSCALNSELPVKSRFHIVQEFNRGVYDFIIATDECNTPKQREFDSDEENMPNDDQKAEAEKKSKKRREKDLEFGVSRGIDFKHVQAVINFDMPKSSRSYQHRVGRTARGVGTSGFALSFVTVAESINNEKGNPDRLNTKKGDEMVLERIQKRQKAAGRELNHFAFDMGPVEAFRYRCQDAYRAITTIAIRDARLKEIRQEILNSEKLKSHFEDNPQDVDALRHDIPLHTAKIQPHLRRIPGYLLPKGKLPSNTATNQGFIPFKVEKKRSRAKSSKRKKSDPLKTFKK